MSIHTLPPGTDVLEARRAEMAAHAHAHMGTDPEALYATLRAIVLRTLALEKGLIPLDGLVWPDPDPLASLAGEMAKPDGEMSLGHHIAWPIMEALVIRVPGVEARLAHLEGKPPEVDRPTLTMFQQMGAEMAVNGGHLPRHQGRYIEAVKQLVGRVLDAEARLIALVTRSPAANVVTDSTVAGT